MVMMMNDDETMMRLPYCNEFQSVGRNSPDQSLPLWSGVLACLLCSGQSYFRTSNTRKFGQHKVNFHPSFLLNTHFSNLRSIARQMFLEKSRSQRCRANKSRHVEPFQEMSINKFQKILFRAPNPPAFQGFPTSWHEGSLMKKVERFHNSHNSPSTAPQLIQQ